MSDNNKLINDVKAGNIAEVKTALNNLPENGNFELVDEPNPRHTHEDLIKAVKSGDLNAVQAALNAGAGTNFVEPKKIQDGELANVVNDIVINDRLLRNFKGDAVIGDIHGAGALALHEAAAKMMKDVKLIERTPMELREKFTDVQEKNKKNTPD